MAKIGDSCGRRALRGNSRSHSNIATVRHQQINLQWRRLPGGRRRLCVNCIKTMHRDAPRPKTA